MQRKAKKLFGYRYIFKDLSHEEKLKKCGLTTLQRSRGDLIEAYEI